MAIKFEESNHHDANWSTELKNFEDEKDLLLSLTLQNFEQKIVGFKKFSTLWRLEKERPKEFLQLVVGLNNVDKSKINVADLKNFVGGDFVREFTMINDEKLNKLSANILDDLCYRIL